VPKLTFQQTARKPNLLPFPQRRTCRTLTRLTLEHLPQRGLLGRQRRFRSGVNIWFPDDPADRIYFLERGEVTVLGVDQHGRELLLQVVTQGEPFGELCLCREEGGLRRTSARAAGDTAVLEIEYRAFLGYVKTDTDTLSALLCTLCLRLSDCEVRTEILAYRGAEERLGRLLLQLAAAAAIPDHRKREMATLAVSYQELAAMAAMSHPHVTVTLGRFRRRQLIQYSRAQALQVNVAALTSYLGEQRPDRFSSEAGL